MISFRHSPSLAGGRSLPFALLLSLLLSGCWAFGITDTEGLKDPGERGVLFIGNSHTDLHNVPALVEGLARLSGDTELRAHGIVGNNYALEDHWVDGRARDALTRYRWKYVVMQQGPSSLPDNQIHLRTWTQTFRPLITAAGAEPVLYQIWPSQARRMDADNALASYRNAAAAVDGLLAPVGDAFTLALEAQPPLPMYASDAFHASIHGAYVAALIIHARINESDPRILSPVIPGVGAGAVSESDIRRLQQVAYDALQRNPARP